MSKDKLIGHDIYLKNFLSLYKNNKLPTKILLSGKKGIGKSLLVKSFVNSIQDNKNSNLLIINDVHANILNIKKKDEKKKY